MELVQSALGAVQITYSLIATMLISGFSRALRATIRPIRPVNASDTFDITYEKPTESVRKSPSQS